MYEIKGFAFLTKDENNKPYPFKEGIIAKSWEDAHRIFHNEGL